MRPSANAPVSEKNTESKDGIEIVGGHYGETRFFEEVGTGALGTAMTGTGLAQAFNHIGNDESKTGKMKITVLTGSLRAKGNSAYLAEQFIKGAQEKGHEIYRFDCAFKHVEPCRACNRCGMNGTCIFNDDFLELRPKLIESDMVVFATPMYYFGISAQMKRVIDRFYAINGQIKGASKKSRLPDDIRQHSRQGSRADARPLPHAAGLLRLDQRG